MLFALYFNEDYRDSGFSCCMTIGIIGSDAAALQWFCAFCVRREAAKLQKEAAAIEASLEDKRLRRHNMLLECKVQDLKIRLLSGSLDDISEIEVLYMSKDRCRVGAIINLEFNYILFFTGLVVLNNNDKLIGFV